MVRFTDYEVGDYRVEADGSVYGPKGNRLKPFPVGAGYYQVGFGNEYRAYVHRLVAAKFIDNPENKPCVNHIDGNKANNAVGNLEWCSRSSNTLHGISTGLINRCKETGRFI